MEVLLVIVVIFALTFDFTNGFHDTANSIATLVGTRALSPQKAVAMAATLNFVGAFASLEVAATVGKDIVDPNVVTLELVLAALTGAISWNLITWFYGLPSSSSHALIGGLVGATIAQGAGGVSWPGVTHKVLIPSILAPTIGFLAAVAMMAVLMRATKNMTLARGNHTFRRLQLLSGGWLAFTHGMNDAQKTMGIMALALVASGHLSASSFEPPLWVILSAASAMALGTYAGGWKIIKTLGGKVVRMSPLQGFSASFAGASALQAAGMAGFPVSTTHCVSGCVMGAGAANRVSSVRWNVAGDIVTAWIMTLPAAAVVGALAYGLTMLSPVLLVGVAGTLATILQLASRRRAAGVAAH